MGMAVGMPYTGAVVPMAGASTGRVVMAGTVGPKPAGAPLIAAIGTARAGDADELDGAGPLSDCGLRLLASRFTRPIPAAPRKDGAAAGAWVLLLAALGGGGARLALIGCAAGWKGSRRVAASCSPMRSSGFEAGCAVWKWPKSANPADAVAGAAAGTGSNGSATLTSGAAGTADGLDRGAAVVAD